MTTPHPLPTKEQLEHAAAIAEGQVKHAEAVVETLGEPICKALGHLESLASMKLTARLLRALASGDAVVCEGKPAVYIDETITASEALYCPLEKLP